MLPAVPVAGVGLGGAGGPQETPLFCPGEGLQGRLSGGTGGGGLDGDLSRGVIGTGVEGEMGVRGQRSWASIFEPFIPGEVSHRDQGRRMSRGCWGRPGMRDPKRTLFSPFGILRRPLPWVGRWLPPMEGLSPGLNTHPLSALLRASSRQLKRKS